MVVFGTRPEAIKMAPLCHKLLSHNSFKTLICVTAQHREMLDQVLDIFELSPDIDLNIMQKEQDLTQLTSIILLKVRDVLSEFKPDLVFVHGDTTTSFVTSLACFYAGIKIAHVEAGLRTNDIHAPFPEEYNRRTTGILADYHFAPTDKSKQNLIKEGVQKRNITVTGNTVVDSLNLILKKIEGGSNRSHLTKERLDSSLKFNWQSETFILVTGHRRENFGKGFLNICEAIKELALENPDVHFVYPVHLNPNVQKPVKKILNKLENVWLISPLDYQDFIYLLKYSYLVLTDSGGIQEEAPSLGKPVLLMRDVTERPEAIDSGIVKLVGASKKNIISSINTLLNNKKAYLKMSNINNPYGDGKACERIIDFIENKLSD